jgi:hypothetical protein
MTILKYMLGAALALSVNTLSAAETRDRRAEAYFQSKQNAALLSQAIESGDNQKIRSLLIKSGIKIAKTAPITTNVDTTSRKRKQFMIGIRTHPTGIFVLTREFE